MGLLCIYCISNSETAHYLTYNIYLFGMNELRFYSKLDTCGSEQHPTDSRYRSMGFQHYLWNEKLIGVQTYNESQKL